MSNRLLKKLYGESVVAVISLDDSSDDEETQTLQQLQVCHHIVPPPPIDVFTLSSDEEEECEQTDDNEQTISFANTDNDRVNVPQEQQQQEECEQTDDNEQLISISNTDKDRVNVPQEEEKEEEEVKEKEEEKEQQLHTTIEDIVKSIVNDLVSQVEYCENYANNTSSTRFVISMDDYSSDDEEEGVVETDKALQVCDDILPRAPIDVFTLSSDEEEEYEEYEQNDDNVQTISIANADNDRVNRQEEEEEKEEEQQQLHTTETEVNIEELENNVKDSDEYQKMNRNPTVDESIASNDEQCDSDVQIFETINYTQLKQNHKLNNKSDDIKRFQTIFSYGVANHTVTNKEDINSGEDELMIIDERDTKQSLPQKEVILISDDEDDNVVIMCVKEPARDYKMRRQSNEVQICSYKYSPKSYSNSSQYQWQSVLCEPSTSSASSARFRDNFKTDRLNQFGSECFTRSITSTITTVIKPEPDIALLLAEAKRSAKTIKSETNCTNKMSVSSVVRPAENLEDIVIIADSLKIDINIVRNVVNLIADKCTVPFIARYRLSLIGDIDIDQVCQISALYNELIETRDRAKHVEVLLRNQNQLTLQIEKALKCCRNVFEVEHLYQFCVNDNEESTKARRLGLTDSAFELLEGKDIDPNDFINLLTIGLHSTKAISDGWSAIIVDIISKDCDILQFLIATCKTNVPTIEITVDHEKAKELLYNQQTQSNNSSTIEKYLKFNSFKKPINDISAHELMPIERGEANGVLKVYLDFPIPILNQLMDTCFRKWNLISPNFLAICVRKAWNNHLKPCLTEYIRHDLRRKAHLTALNVFRKNVRQLLSEPPLTHTTVIGVDPGYAYGYRVVVVSPCGLPLSHRVVKLDTTANRDIAAYHLLNLLNDSGPTFIALGNADGSRKFEDFLQQRIRSEFFKPLDVRYKVVSDRGLNWICKSEDPKEFADFPSYMYRAILIARRLQNPLSILMKCRPKKFEVGMYISDVSDDEVNRVFREVVVECVSFNGVDINETSIDMLSKVSCLDEDIARIIISKRISDGNFTSRSQLQDIIELGFKQYEQSIGFIKIMPTVARNQDSCDQYLNDFISNKRKNFSSITDYDLLDSTSIHPESYGVANDYLELIGATKDEMGTLSIKHKMLQCFQQFTLKQMAERLNTDVSNMKLIIECLRNRSDGADNNVKTVNNVHNSVQYFYELEVGLELKGKVVNVTPIGAFIDCGLNGGITGHLHSSQCVLNHLTVNDPILVSVKSIDKTMQRFKLNFVSKILK